MVFDLVVRGGKLICPDGIIQADLAVQGGKIAAIAEGLTAEKTLDAGGLIILPGGVDPHVHLDMPAGQTTSADDWRTGTLAAVCGGTTSVIDFVEPEEGQTLQDAYHQRRAAAQLASALDFGLHMTVDPAHLGNLGELPGLVNQGLPSFKLYTTYDGFKLDDADLLRVMDAVHMAGGMVLVHCESDAMVAYATRRLIGAGELGPSSHPRSRPPEAEREAIQRVLSLAELTGVTVYIVHISTRDGAEALGRALNAGQAAWGETCPQYLLLDAELYLAPDFQGAKYVCSPPLRTADDREALWLALETGVLHSIGTDHCPFFFQGQKDLGRQDFRNIPGGLPGIQSRLELIHTFGVGSGRLDLRGWVDLCCTQPAKIYGLYPQKGALVEGADADLVLFDPHRSKTVRQEDLRENVDYTPYQGLALEGAVVKVLVDGRVVVQEGDLVAEPRGEFLPRFLEKEER